MCKGGVGGKGNAKHKYVKTFEPGNDGEMKDILLELKSLSDVGLVGFPNVYFFINYFFLRQEKVLSWQVSHELYLK